MSTRLHLTFAASSFVIAMLAFSGKGFSQKTPGHVSSLDTAVPPIEIKGEPAERNTLEALDLSPLARNASKGGGGFDYRKAFARLDFEKVKADMKAVMTASKEEWPADYGHYGPLFIRLAWHSAGTYRAVDGRGGADGGQMRFYPLADWPDNANLDKARRLIQPVVDKYYPNLSWADAMVLAGELAIEDMGFDTLGFAGGRVDDAGPDMVYWGPEDAFLKSQRFDKKGNLQLPLAASVMGLIYVNPEGPDGKPDPLKSAERIRITFGRMGMDDEETVALIAGGHTFGKTHGTPLPAGCLAVDKETKRVDCPEAKGKYTNTSGIEGSWTSNPTRWTHDYLTNLYKYEWRLSKGPGGKYQWYPVGLDDADRAPDAHDPGKRVTITMLTTDLALRYDPAYGAITKRWLDDPKAFGDAFARAWFKLTHRDLGPKARYLGGDFPKQDLIFQDPIPAVSHDLVGADEVADLKRRLKASGLTVQSMVKTAWASASSYRNTDMRGGANGARIRLEPQRSWEVNEPDRLAADLATLERVKSEFDASMAKAGRKTRISLADLIVLAGNVGVEIAAERAGVSVAIPFRPGRTDAAQDQTDIKSFDQMKVTHDGFRNFYDPAGSYLPPLRAFVDRAEVLGLTKTEMVVLAGGLRVLGATHGNSRHGVLTSEVGRLTNDYFANLIDRSTTWVPSREEKGVYVGVDARTGKQKWTATTQDLAFGRNPELRVVAFNYATAANKRKFVADFAASWDKVMNLDRFDLETR